MLNKIILFLFLTFGLVMGLSAKLPKLSYKTGDKIAVVGAGISGIAITRGLIENGVPAEDITVIEKSELPGGKVRTINHKGRPYELGAAVVIEGRYDQIINLGKHHGITRRALQPTKFIDTKNGVIKPGLEPGNPILVKMQKQSIAYLENYKKNWMPITEWNGFAKIPPDLDNMSWKDFLQNYKKKYGNGVGIELLNFRLSTALGGSGYVMMQDPPFAAQILRWISPDLLRSINKPGNVQIFNAVKRGQCIKGLKGEQPLGGFQCLLMREARELKQKRINFLFGTEVIKFLREKNGVTVTLKNNKEKIKSKKFAHVFYTADLRNLSKNKWAKGLLSKPTKGEKKLINSISVYPYRSYLIKLKIPKVGDSKIKNYSGVFGLLPHMLKGENKKGVLMVKPYKDSDVVKLYAFGGKKVKDKGILESFAKDIKGLNISFNPRVDVIDSQQWEYFPHINPKSGITLSHFFNGMMARQGVGGLWFAGEVFGFGLTIDVYEQGMSIAERFVKKTL